MKRLVLILTFLMVSTTFAANGTGVILKAGLLMGNTSDSGAAAEDFQSLNFAPNLILGFEFSLNRAISFDVGAGALLNTLDYVVLKDIDFSNVTDPGGNYTAAGKTRLLYLTVPIRAKFMAPTEQGGVYLTVGPKFDFLMGVEEKRESGTADSLMNKGSYSSLNFSLGLHIGGEIEVGKHHMTLETGYDFGLTDVLDASTYKVTSGQITLLSVGFRFNTDMIDD